MPCLFNFTKLRQTKKAISTPDLLQTTQFIFYESNYAALLTSGENIFFLNLNNLLLEAKIF